MKDAAKRAGAGLALIIAACCPGVWLQVTRERPAPIPGATALSDLASHPIDVPLNLDNRVELLTGGRDDPALRERAIGFQERRDPASDLKYQRSRIAHALDAIVALAGAELTQLALPWTGPYRATLTSCRAGGCDSVKLPYQPDLHAFTLPAEPTFAIVSHTAGGKTERWLRAVDSCEGLTAEGDPETLDAAVAGPCEGATERGLYLGLDHAVPLVPGRGQTITVEVQLATEVELTPPTALTFVHLSDTQLRDPEMKIVDRRLSARLDRLIPSFEFDEEQERYSAQVTEAIVETVNEEIRRARASGDPAAVPAFVLHTGDSIDSGTYRELDRFHEIMDRLLVPWLNAIGNHDVLVFGNMMPIDSDDPTDRFCASFRSVAEPYLGWVSRALAGGLCIDATILGHPGPRDRFVAERDHATSLANFIREHDHGVNRPFALLTTVPKDAPCDDVFPDEVGWAHGFERGTGHHAFRVPTGLTTADGQVRNAAFLVMNTEDLDPREGGTMGRLGDDQYTWLQHAFGCVDSSDLIFLVGHHQLSEIRTPSGRVLRLDPLLQDPRIVAYLYGHNHRHGLCKDHGSCGKLYRGVTTHFWELETASLIEAPEEGRLVRLKDLGGGLAYFETVVFSVNLRDRSTVFARQIQLALDGAQRDHCQQPGFRCTPDHRVLRDDGEHTNARLFFRLP